LMREIPKIGGSLAGSGERAGAGERCGPQRAICRCRRHPNERSWPQNPRESGECRFSPMTKRVLTAAGVTTRFCSGVSTAFGWLTPGRRKAQREYAAAVKEAEQMSEFVGDSKRFAKWKVAQLKCQYFASAYIDDKTSRVPSIVNSSDGMLEGVIQKVLGEADAVTDDQYCRSAILESLSELMCKTGQFVRAENVIELITVDIIRKKARETLAEEQSKLLRRVCETANGSG
jgi:hypothetical protein